MRGVARGDVNSYAHFSFPQTTQTEGGEITAQMNEVVVAEKIHAELGASVAPRWMACPGSIRLSREVPRPPTTEFAQEGTRAHAVAELCLNKGVDPEFFIGMEIEGGVVDEDMAENVAVYVDHCRAINAECDINWVERRFNLAPLGPPGPMFGTADHGAYSRAARRLYVDDLKFGQGVVVEAKENEQLLYYAVGFVLSLDPNEYPIDDVVVTIVQPRASHPDGAIRSYTITYLELFEFAGELLEAARATTDPNAPLNPGSHCRFCPAAGKCPAQFEHAQQLAQIEFKVETPSIPPAPETMPMSMVVEMLPQMEILEAWIKACRAHVFTALEAGDDVPGYKLVAKRATRKWGDTDGAIQILRSKKLQDEEIFNMKLLSPAQIEKVVGKKEFAKSLAPAVVKVSSGYKMVPDSDPAPAISVTRGEEFDLLPAPASE